MLRLQAKVYRKMGLHAKANASYHEASNLSEHQLLSLWRDWMLLCIEVYKKTNAK